MPWPGRRRCWPWPPLLALPPLLTGRSIPVRGERRGEERSSEREVAGEELSPAVAAARIAVVAARIAVVEEAKSERERAREGDCDRCLFVDTGH